MSQPTGARYYALNKDHNWGPYLKATTLYNNAVPPAILPALERPFTVRNVMFPDVLVGQTTWVKKSYKFVPTYDFVTYPGIGFDDNVVKVAGTWIEETIDNNDDALYEVSTGTESHVLVGPDSGWSALNNVAGGTNTAVLGGTNNTITSNAFRSTILSGSLNNIDEADFSVILGGDNNTIDGTYTLLFGSTNQADQLDPTDQNNTILNGSGNVLWHATGASTQYCGIYNGTNNYIRGVYNVLVSCSSSGIDSDQSFHNFLGATNGCFVGNGSASNDVVQYTFIGTGDNSYIGINDNNSTTQYCTMIAVGSCQVQGGSFNTIITGFGSNILNNATDGNALNCVMLMGDNNNITGEYILLGGNSNSITRTANSDSLFHATILNGSSNAITTGGFSTDHISIVNGENNTINGGIKGTILNGNGNTITNALHACIVSGSINTIENGAQNVVIVNGQDCVIKNTARAATVNGSFGRASMRGEQVHSGGGFGDVPGTAQESRIIMTGTTTDNTANLGLNNTSDNIPFENERTIAVRAMITAHRTVNDSDKGAYFEIRGVYRKTGGTLVLLGGSTQTNTVYQLPVTLTASLAIVSNELTVTVSSPLDGGGVYNWVAELTMVIAGD